MEGVVVKIGELEAIVTVVFNLTMLLVVGDHEDGQAMLDVEAPQPLAAARQERFGARRDGLQNAVDLLLELDAFEGAEGLGAAEPAVAALDGLDQLAEAVDD